jgi:hypothetical protein
MGSGRYLGLLSEHRRSTSSLVLKLSPHLKFSNPTIRGIAARDLPNVNNNSDPQVNALQGGRVLSTMCIKRKPSELPLFPIIKAQAADDLQLIT